MAKFSWFTRRYVDHAIERILRDGVPAHRRSTRYDLVTDAGVRLPPKFVISEAAKLAGEDFDESDFGGGNEANGALQRLGFNILKRRTGVLSRAHEPVAKTEPGETTPADLKPRDQIRRQTLHTRCGGRAQGGVSPSTRSPYVFLFTEPKLATEHGSVDGWRDDGDFYYTGEGQFGDQEMKSGNAAILHHVQDGRSLHLFYGSGGTVPYAGRFRVRSDHPYDLTDSPETGDGPTRSVIVFRLQSLGDVYQWGDIFPVAPAEPNVETVALEEHNTERYAVNPRQATTVRAALRWTQFRRV